MVSAIYYMTVLSHGQRGALQIATGSSNTSTREAKKPASSNIGYVKPCLAGARKI